MPIKQPSAPLLPRMSAPEIALFKQHLKGARFLLEFGCGGSTLLAAQQGVRRITSVDSDPAWLEQVAAQPKIRGLQFTGRYADIGPIGLWGKPRRKAYAHRWPAYSTAVWAELKASPDLVLVDGRFRVACCLQALLHTQPGAKILFHDFWDRPRYHAVLRYLDCLGRADTLAVLRAKPRVDWKSLAQDLAAYLLNPA
jgi:hypothetical protein